MESNREQATHIELSPLEDAIREVASVFRRHRLGYDQTAYVVRQARKRIGIRLESRQKRLPRNLSDAELKAFFEAIEAGGDATHLLLFRLLYSTGMRVSELCSVRRTDVDLAARTVRVNQGKGSKDRVVLFEPGLQLPLRLHMDVTREFTYLFETRRREKLSARWVQLLAKRYGEAAGIDRMHPHRLRHTMLTALTRAKLTDAQIQLVSGHASKKSLETYQSLALRDVRDDYDRAMGGR